MHQPRPLANLKIDELAAEFVGARNYGDVQRLKALDDELSRRKSRRARSLSAHVSLALASAAKRAAQVVHMRTLAIALAAVLAALTPAHAGDEVEVDFDQVPALHIPLGKRVVSARPAFEDYAFMLFDVCDALSLEGDDCLIYPLNASLGGNVAVATIFDGNRVIIYDRELSPLVGYEGAEMIIAHELAHHHCGHIGTAPDPKQELAADALAGAAARLMGRSLEAALSAVAILAERPSLTHPGRQARIEAITAGWNDPEKAKGC